MIKPGQLPECGPGEQLQSATGIRYAIPENGIAHPIGQARLKAFPGRVPALFAEAGNAEVGITYRGDLLQKQRDIGRVILAVAVHGDDPREPRCLYSRTQCTALADAAAVSDALKRAAQRGSGCPGGFQCLVFATIIHQDNFVVVVVVKYRMNFPEQAGDIVRFIPGGNHYRYGSFGWHRGYLGNGDVEMLGAGQRPVNVMVRYQP